MCDRLWIPYSGFQYDLFSQKPGEGGQRDLDLIKSWGLEYRKTPEGEPNVADLLNLGDIISTNYGQALERRFGLIFEVLETRGPFYFSPIEQPGTKYPNYSAICRSTDGSYTWSELWFNELVAVGKRILHLFKNNDSEIFVLEKRTRAFQRSLFGTEVPI
jgi:hypothetical protein